MMMKQKRTKMKQDPPSLTVRDNEGEMKTIIPKKDSCYLAALSKKTLHVNLTWTGGRMHYCQK